MKFDPEAGSLKTESSERTVPIHPVIVESDFLQFVKAAGSGPVFKGLKADRFGNRGGSATKILGRWVRSLGIVDKRISPSHSWRHRFKTLCRRYEIPLDIGDALTGHYKKTVSSSYGEFPVEALYREICRIPKIDI